MKRSILPLILTMLAPLTCANAAAPSPLMQALGDEVKQQEIAGGIVVVGNADGIIEMAVGGHADLATKRTMEQNDMFWIASMTKPITACAIMKLQEQGKLQLQDPVAKYLPEFQALKDAQGNAASVTIAQCLSHTSGLSDVPRDKEAALTSLESVTKLVATLPLQFAPGSRWQYCQSSINTAARVVEVVAGTSFETFLQTNFFTPLEMKDTTFYPSEEQSKRVVTSYRRQNGKLEATPLGFLGGKALTDRSRYPRANGGLFSTATDYGHFAQMLLGRGQWRGKRIMSEESVKEMSRVQTADLKTGFTAGNGWGWGVCVVREPQGVSASLSPGSFGHGGAYGTQCWIDPARGFYFLLLVQRADFPNSDGSGTRQRLQEAARTYVRE
jgi:CubicO group peptidase (beta-lactamase class C family)